MYQLRDSSGHFVSRARTLAAAHRASRQRNRTGSVVLNCAHGNRSPSRKVSALFVKEVRLALKEMGVKEGYVVIVSLGPHDHNPHDHPLPGSAYPRVFCSLYEAVEYAQERKAWGKIKIERVDGSVHPKTNLLRGTVVWRSWTPGAFGGWSSDANMARRRTFAEARDEILQYLRGQGWEVRGDLKYPHAISSDWPERRKIHLYFKSQAVYLGVGNISGMGGTHSMWVDIRDLDGPTFLQAVESDARRERGAA